MTLFGPEEFGSKTFFMEPDGAGAGGGTAVLDDPENGDPGSGPVMLSEEEANARVEKAVQTRLANTKRDNTQLTKQLGDLTSQAEDYKSQLETANAERQVELEELNAKIASLESTAEQGDQAAELKGQIRQTTERYERLQKRHEDELVKVREEVATERKAREQAEIQQREADRQRALTDALSRAECTDVSRAARYFDSQVVYDDVESRFLFRDENGDLTDVADGLKSEMPDYWKPASIRGGSGATSGSPGSSRGSNKSKVDALQKQLDEAMQKVANTRATPSAMLVVDRLRREIKAAEAGAD